MSNEKANDIKAKLGTELSSVMQQEAKLPKKPVTAEAVVNTEEVTETKEETEELDIVTKVETTPVVTPAEPFVSEAFQNLLKDSREDVSSQPTVTPANILDGINVDLNSIEINHQASEFDLIEIEKVLNDNGKKVMQVVAVQSAYSAEMSSLKNQEIQNISDANVDFYNFKKRLYKALWNHIENTSVGKMDFATWMKVTSYFDVETLLYGAYCQTFPYENKYSLQCPKPDCKNAFDVSVNNSTLIETRGRDEETFSKINEIISNVKNAKDLVGKSHVHTMKRISTDESKIVFDVQIPSVYDYLEGILSNVDEEFAEEYSTTLGVALFIKQILVPDVVTYQRTGNLSYIPITDKGKMITLIANLSFYDGTQLTEDINEFTDKYRINYSIKNVSCPSCGHEMADIPMSMEDVLFIAIRQGKREKNDQTVTSNT